MPSTATVTLRIGFDIFARLSRAYRSIRLAKISCHYATSAWRPCRQMCHRAVKS
jgi:hypothetical protein